MRENNIWPYWLLIFEARIFNLGFLELLRGPGVGLVDRGVRVGSCGPKWEIKPDEWVCGENHQPGFKRGTSYFHLLYTGHSKKNFDPRKRKVSYCLSVKESMVCLFPEVRMVPDSLNWGVGVGYGGKATGGQGWRGLQDALISFTVTLGVGPCSFPLSI